MCKARNDLALAQLARDNNFLAQACYFASQAAEKALKSALLELSIEPSHTHGLNDLVRRLEKAGLDMAELNRLPLRSLSRMAIQSPYPQDARPPAEPFDPGDAGSGSEDRRSGDQTSGCSQCRAITDLMHPCMNASSYLKKQADLSMPSAQAQRRMAPATVQLPTRVKSLVRRDSGKSLEAQWQLAIPEIVGTKLTSWISSYRIPAPARSPAGPAHCAQM